MSLTRFLPYVILPLLAAGIMWFLSSTLLFLTDVLGTTKRKPARRQGSPAHVLVVLGSGGHTAEMLAMLRDLNPSRITFRTYVVSSGDDFSAKKAIEFESKLEEAASAQVVDDGKARQQAHVGSACYAVATVPRARRIYQPLYTAPWTSLQCFIGCVRVLTSGRQGYPDLIVTNGPATAVIVVVAALSLKALGLAARGSMRTLYVESFARVRRLSLSGRILLRLADRFLVQWETLRRRVGAPAEYRGVLV